MDNNSINEEITEEITENERNEKRLQDRYNHAKKRYDELSEMLKNWDNLDYKPVCVKSTYEKRISDITKILDKIKKEAKEKDITLK